MTLTFDVLKAKGKPDDNRRPGTSCPFCDVAGLSGILRQEGDRIWLKNKFPTLHATDQTVFIETSEHDADIVDYAPERLHAVMRFALSCWDEMAASGHYRSVLMYKNWGPLSGGSLVHPHMQIVGLVDEDGYASVAPEHFEGVDVWSRGGVRVTISTQPIMGFVEVNVSMSGAATEIDLFADAVQAAVRYVLNDHHGGRCTSYNLFFYRMGARVVCKVVPRWIVSPYYVGYRLAQVNAETTLRDDAACLRERLSAL